MRNRKDGGFKTNALGVTMTGGPLGEKTDSGFGFQISAEVTEFVMVLNTGAKVCLPASLLKGQ